MDEEKKGLFTVAEAAAAWGISTQAIYQRLHKLQKEGFVVAQGKKRYITSEGIEAKQPEYKQLAKEVGKGLPTLQAELTNLQTEVDSLKEQLLEAGEDINGLEMQLREAQAQASSLQATVTAQEAHIDSLKNALDREQALHMAALQQRLPAGRGQGFFAWLRGKKSE